MAIEMAKIDRDALRKNAQRLAEKLSGDVPAVDQRSGDASEVLGKRVEALEEEREVTRTLLDALGAKLDGAKRDPAAVAEVVDYAKQAIDLLGSSE